MPFCLVSPLTFNAVSELVEFHDLRTLHFLYAVPLLHSKIFMHFNGKHQFIPTPISNFLKLNYTTPFFILQSNTYSSFLCPTLKNFMLSFTPFICLSKVLFPVLIIWCNVLTSFSPACFATCIPNQFSKLLP